MTIAQFQKAQGEINELDYINASLKKLNVFSGDNDKDPRTHFKVGLDVNLGTFRAFDVPMSVFDSVRNILTDYYMEQKKQHEKILEEL